MAFLTSERIARAAPGFAAGWIARAAAWLNEGGERSHARRVASTAFVIRVASAAIAFASQVLLARWMGSFEFGIYVYVWTWVLLIGGFLDLGLASGAQRFIPEYIERKMPALLRGYIKGARLIAFGFSTAAGALGALGVWALTPFIDHYALIPLYIGCLTLPLYGLLHVQDGISRCYSWVWLALLPPYVVRQVLLIAMMAGAHVAGFATDALTAAILASAALWVATLGQLVVLNRKLKGAVAPGPAEYDVPRWLKTSLPMVFIEAFYLLMMYADVLILNQFRSPDEVAVYYAAAKTLSLVVFIYFSVSAASAHKYSEFHIAGDRERLAEFVADSVRWTFWPSLAATVFVLAFGWPLLWLFGEKFVEGYPLMFVLAIGIMARAAIGPGERLLNMVGQQRTCTIVAASTFAINLALCLMLIPKFGAFGAAVACSTAFVIESVLLFFAAKRSIGLHIFVWGRPQGR